MMHRKIILVVDDMSENLTLIRSMLKDHFDVRLAKSGKMALGLLANLKVDLILLDIEMPGMTGFEFLKRLYDTDSLNKKTPVIFITSHADRDLINEAINAGAKDYLLKPVKTEALYKKIDDVIGMPEIKTNPLEGNLKSLLSAAASADSERIEDFLKELQRISLTRDERIRNSIDEIGKLMHAFEYERGITKINDLLHNLSLNRPW